MPSRLPPAFHAPRCAAVLLLVLAGVGAPITVRAEPLDPWGEGRQWFSFRAGYAKSTVKESGDGNVGAGFGFTRVGKGLWSVGGFAHLELLGRFAGSAEIEIPATLEVARHSAWKSGVRPYLGFGGGAFYHKFYRTGADIADLRPGFYFLGGMNAPISDHSLLGFDVRMVFQGSASSENPVFPNSREDAVHWSAKLNYSRVE
jgi:hypothetical protein